MKKSFKPAMLSMAVALGITGVGAGGAYAAQPASELDWSYKVPANLDLDSGFRFGTFAGDNLYFWAVKGNKSHIVQSFDQDNGGKDNWTYDFRGSSEILTSSGQVLHDKDGNSYFLRKKDKDKQYKLEVVNAEGKLKWETSLGGGDVKQFQILDNDSLVVTDIAYPKNAEVVQTFSIFDKNGKLKSTKKVKASEIHNEGALISLLPNGQVLAQGPKIQLFRSLNDLKKPVLEHQMPKWTTIGLNGRSVDFGPAVFSLSGGQTLIQFDKSDMSAVEIKEGAQEIDPKLIKRSKSLVLFDAQGVKKWERELSTKAAFVPTGDGFVLQSGNKLELYGADNKLRTGKDFEGEDLWLAKAKTTDEIVLTSEKAGTFKALDPKDLSVKYELDMNEESPAQATYSFLYEGGGELYVHATDGNVNKTVSHYTLK
ncbi:hypothetical protein [Saccharibacillus deserti]|uniref:hypothetical protein n=1 Tax=Saccharibacillus deserti TaxID=1634444 RepID=UPI0015531B7A|nr:hypothetical protein [Saccharibacillus deserti]